MPPAPSEAVKQALLKAVGTGHGKLPAAARDVRPIIVSIKYVRLRLLLRSLTG